MPRKKKSALNQSSSVEPMKEEVIKTPVEEPTKIELTVDGNDLVEKLEVIHTPIIEEEGKIDELPTPEFVNDPIPIIIPVEPKEEKTEVTELTITKPSKAQLAKLSKAGLRWYQRTGMLPK